jgi:putative transposase
MSFIKVWLHYVWSTKRRAPTLVEPFRSLLFEHMKENAREKNIYLDRINGFDDHVHCLFSMNTAQSLDKIAQLLKGESAFWFNNKKWIQYLPA